jgi:hypothetical protein
MFIPMKQERVNKDTQEIKEEIKKKHNKYKLNSIEANSD